MSIPLVLPHEIESQSHHFSYARVKGELHQLFNYYDLKWILLFYQHRKNLIREITMFPSATS